MSCKIILSTLIFFVLSQFVQSEIIDKENNFSGWRIPDRSFFNLDSISKRKMNDLPEFLIEHFIIKDQDTYYLINKKVSTDSRQAELSEKISSFKRERINSFDIISLNTKDKSRIYRIFSAIESNAILYYRNQMDIKKDGIGFEDGIESAELSIYYLLDYDNDGIFETRIWDDERENATPEKMFYLILIDYLKNRVIEYNPSIEKLLKLKKVWLNFVENPMSGALKNFYKSLPEKDIEPWLKKLKDFNSYERKVDVIERSRNLLKSLKEWQKKSLFREGEATKEEKLLMHHISENLHLIFEEFIYGNPYALPTTLKLYPILREEKSLELDRMLVIFCLINPEIFLKDLKDHKKIITINQALDRTFGYEMIGFLKNAKREIRILINVINRVKNKELFDIKQECIEYLKNREKELIN